MKVGWAGQVSDMGEIFVVIETRVLPWEYGLDP